MNIQNNIINPKNLYLMFFFFFLVLKVQKKINSSYDVNSFYFRIIIFPKLLIRLFAFSFLL